MIIDPNKITNYKRTEAELQLFILFAVVVAGKNSRQMAAKIAAFFDTYTPSQDPGFRLSPFLMIRDMDARGELEDRLRDFKMGQYARYAAAFRALAAKDTHWLKWCSVGQLEEIAGIGPKTARFFILHSRVGARFAVLDTHILSFLRDNGQPHAPKSTPKGTLYAQLEAAYIAHCDSRGLNLAAFDLQIWTLYSQKALKQ